jgi:hypothetical protein
MLVFIDESGDAGMKYDSGSSSKYFTVTLVVFEDNDDAFRAEKRICLLKHELGLPEYFEFHFSKLSRNYRKEF